MPPDALHEDAAPFTLIGAESRAVPLLLAAPHGGRNYPAAVLAAMRQPDMAPLRLEDRHIDTLAREVAAQIGAPLLVANAPRAVIDLNRAEDDIDWGMVGGKPGSAPRGVRHSAANRRARSGLGLVPRRLPGTGEIWRQPLAAADLVTRISTIHRPYHAQIIRVLEGLKDHWGAALLIDLHSMPPLPCAAPGLVPANIVVGDRFGMACDPGLSARALQALGGLGWRAAHNRPYAGGHVLERHGRPRQGLHAMQLEVCRSSYLDADLASPSAQMGAVAADLAQVLRELAAHTATLARHGGLALAAE